jgi:hypothetical protein
VNSLCVICRSTLITGALLFAGLANATPITGPGDPALSGATYWGFEELAYTSNSSASITDPTGGLTIDPSGSSTYDIVDFSGSGYGSGVKHFRTSSPNTYDFIFSTEVSAFALNLNAVNTTWTATAYDITNTLIESVSWAPNCNSGNCSVDYYRGIAASGIVRFSLTGSDYISVDDIYFVPSTVPAPATLALLGLGLIGLGFSRRKSA